MENNFRSSNPGGLSNKSADPLDKLWKNWNKESTNKVVKKQGKFGALDDDETMGNTSKLTKSELTRFKSKFFISMNSHSITLVFVL